MTNVNEFLPDHVGEAGTPLLTIEGRQRLPAISFLLGLFILGAVTVSPLEGWNYVVRGIGIVLAAAFLIRFVGTPALPNAETILFMCWLLWSFLGVLVAKAPGLFWPAMGTLWQIWALLAIVSVFTQTRKSLSYNLLAFLVGSLVVIYYSYVTGEYQRAEREGVRVAGLAVNANQFGWIMVLASVALAYFWMLPTRLGLLKKIVILPIGMVILVLIGLSGSRKALVGLVAFYVCWAVFCYGKQLWRKPLLTGLAAVVLGGVLGGTYVLGGVGESSAVQRLLISFDFLRGVPTHGETGEERIQLFRIAWDVFTRNPILGVGLDNYRAYAGMAPAHSEYPEVACDTGLPGFIIYYSIYVALWVRCGRIIRHAGGSHAAQVARLCRAMLVMVMVMNFGRGNFADKSAWVIFASLIGYTSAAWNEIKQRRALARVSGVPAAEGQDWGPEGLAPGV